MGTPTTSMGFHTAFICPFTTSTAIIMASTLTRPTLTLKATANTLKPLQQSQSLYRVELSQALSLPLQALLWPLHALSRTLHTLSCEILPAYSKTYIFTAYIVQNKLLGRENDFRSNESACRESRVPLEYFGDREYF
jgi:hypothetical protein